jgi:beta-N-acetylhexosaminidase
LPTHDLQRLAGAVLVGGFDGTVLPDETRARLSAGHLAGVIAFRRNLVLRDGAVDLDALCALTRAVADAPSSQGLRPVFAIDQEGGRVARLGSPFLRLPPMRRLGRAGDLGLTERCGAALGAELYALGVTLDFAPVCDVDSNPDNPVIGDRAFSDAPEAVSAHAVAFLRGMQSAGVAACAKHFPGHGDTSTDSHLTLPVLAHARERLDAVELAPFRAAFAAGVATVMTAHVRFDALDPDVPATLSPRVIAGLLRGELAAGRDDLVIVSDDLLMRAVADAWAVAGGRGGRGGRGLRPRAGLRRPRRAGAGAAGARGAGRGGRGFCGAARRGGAAGGWAARAVYGRRGDGGGGEGGDGAPVACGARRGARARRGSSIDVIGGRRG